MIYFCILGAFLLSVLLATLILPRILMISYKKRLFDIPDDKRKVHKIPVPRLGGLSFFPVILITVSLVVGIQGSFSGYLLSEDWGWDLFIRYLFFVVGFTLLYLVGVADDLVGVGYKYKFLVQILSASLFPLSGLWINSLGGLLGIYEIPTFVGILLTIFLTIYITNAINLIDGIDGLASGLSCISLAVLCVICSLTGHSVHALLAAAALGVVLIFYYYNVFSAQGRKLFMGDAGSLTLGYILSFLIIHFWMATDEWSPFTRNLQIVTISTLLIPLLDVVRVFSSRIRERRNPFLPDKNHIHHKLLRTGMRIRWVMITLLLSSLFFILLNFGMSFYMNPTFILIIDLGCWVLMHIVLNRFIIQYEIHTGKKWYKVYLHV